MSSRYSYDIAKMHLKYGTNDAVRKLSPENLKQFLEFRVRFLEEELTELKNSKSGDDAVDALIDLVVVAIGTLDAFDVEPDTAWNAVLEANMNKQVGIKASRPNPLGLPDLIKPEGWQAPSHEGNIGLFSKIYGE